MIKDQNVSVLAIDMDDVTADLNKVALHYRNMDFPENPLTEEDLHCWYGNWDLLKDYYLQEGIYEELPVIEGAEKVLRELSKDYHIIFVTASPSIQATVEKLNWVDKHFPYIGSQNVIATRHKYLINADLLIDDSPEFLPKFKGIRVLMDLVHNRKLTENDYEVKVTNWKEFLYVIREYEKQGVLKPLNNG